MQCSAQSAAALLLLQRGKSPSAHKRLPAVSPFRERAKLVQSPSQVPEDTFNFY